MPTAADIGAVGNALVDDAGDLIVGSADNTVGRLALGSDGQVLTVDTAGTGVAKVKWADASGGPGSNLIINGAMQVAQRNTSVTGITGSGYFTADRWYMENSLGTWTQSVENDAPTGSGFRKSLKMLCTTANASPSSGSYCLMRQLLEGQDLQRIAKGTSDAKPLTLSFWVKSNVTGTFIVDVEDQDNSRAISQAYTVSSSGTWEKKQIDLPADTTGALNNDNGASLLITFWLAAGSSYTGSPLPTTWGARVGSKAANGQSNLAAATNNYWQITGVQLETGPVATPFEFEPFEATLRKCQRYYWLAVSGSGKTFAMGYNLSSSEVRGVVPFPVTMRTEPSLVATSGTDYYSLVRDNANDFFNSLTIVEPSTSASSFQNTAQISGTAGQAGTIKTQNASSSIAFSAEL
jgi:hypothetical protein